MPLPRHSCCRHRNEKYALGGGLSGANTNQVTRAIIDPASNEIKPCRAVNAACFNSTLMIAALVGPRILRPGVQSHIFKEMDRTKCGIKKDVAK